MTADNEPLLDADLPDVTTRTAPDAESASPASVPVKGRWEGRMHWREGAPSSPPADTAQAS